MRTTALLVIWMLAACGSKSGADDGDDGGGSCTTNDQCGGATPICSADGACVQCGTNADCPAESPLCDFDGTCSPGCAGADATATLVEGPSDIIWIVDQSGSMDQETTHVQQKINDFAALIDSAGIDYHVVMIADPTANNAICVPPPLGGPSCGNNVRFRLVPTEVGSNDGPDLMVQEYPAYSDFLRSNAAKHLVFVTDDDSNSSAAQFTSDVLALPPAGTFTGFKVHGIYAFGTPGGNGCDGAFGSGAADGTVYTELIAQTGGASGVICTGDWTTVFNDITQAVLAGSRVSCDLAIPPPPMGMALDPARVNVRYLQGGVGPGATIPKVPTAADCGTAGGWYYDDDAAPTTITLCPTTCADVQDDPAASLQIEFGCSTMVD